MDILQQTQDLVLALEGTNDAAFGRLAKRLNPTTGQSELADLCNLLDRLRVKHESFSAFEKAMDKTTQKTIEMDHPQIVRAKDVLDTIRLILESDTSGEGVNDQLTNQLARFNQAKKGLRKEQIKATYL